MEEIKRIAKLDGYDTVKSLGEIDGREYFAVYNLNDLLDDIWCYISEEGKFIERVFMGSLIIGDEQACEDFENNDPVGIKRKKLREQFEIFQF